MVNLAEVAKGIGVFIGFYIAGVLLNYIVPIMINALSTVYTSDNLSGTIYLGLMFIWTAGILVMPNIFIIRGITEDTGLGTAPEILIAATVFVFGLILTVKGWFFIEGLATISSNAMVTLLFWLGTGIIWVEIILGLPAYLIMRAYTK